MRYIDKYPGCRGCPVIKYCGTMVGSIRLCNSYKDEASEGEEKRHVLSLSYATPTESDYIESKIEMWDNITD